MSSKIEIINLALRRMKEQPIVSIDEESEPANVMSDVYDISLVSEIRDFPYTWAQRTAELAIVSAEEPPDYAYAFQLPADYLDMVEIIVPYVNTTIWSYWWPRISNIYDFANQWEIREGKLYSNYEDVYIKYTVLEEDTTNWDSLFSDAFAWRLAREAGYSLTDRSELIDRADQQYISKIMKARKSNAAESRRMLDLSRDYIKARA